MAPPPLFIGIDGGGTRCRAVLRRGADGPVHVAEGGPANATSDFEGAVRHVRAAIARAAAQAGAGPDEISGAHAHAGLAGILDEACAARVAAALPMRRCVVTDDRHVQVVGALGREDGFLLAIGTGTIAARREGTLVHGVCGWGFAVSDQASGADIGRAALRRALLCHDGIDRHSDLTRALIADRFGSPGAVATFGARAGPAEFAALAPLVLEAADRRDRHGVEILKNGAAYLDRALRSLGFRHGDRLCLAGGLGSHYRAHLVAARTARVTDPEGSALDGALRLAEDAWQAGR